jgi:hypothetical protein
MRMMRLTGRGIGDERGTVPSAAVRVGESGGRRRRAARLRVVAGALAAVVAAPAVAVLTSSAANAETDMRYDIRSTIEEVKGTYFLDVHCQPGSKVLSGSVKATPVKALQQDAGTIGDIFQSYPRDDGGSWAVEGHVEVKSNVRVTAVCSNVAMEPDVRYQVVTREDTVPFGHNIRFAAMCPDYPATVVGGGLWSRNPSRGHLFQSYPTDDGRGWVVEWNNESIGKSSWGHHESGDEVVAVKAVCMYVPTTPFDDILSGYRVVSEQKAVPGPVGTYGYGEVKCPEELDPRGEPAQWLALSGGSFTHEQGQMKTLQSHASHLHQGWAVYVYKVGATYDMNIVVKAVCAYLPPR